MGFGKLVTEATSTGRSNRAASVKDLIVDKYGRKTLSEPQSTENFYYRASGLAYICPRQEVLSFVHGVKSTRIQESDEIANYDLGSGMHYAMQNIILPAIGVLRGAWKCLLCASVHGLRPDDSREPLYKFAIPRPTQCPKCGGKEFLYHEYFLNNEYGTGGHMDGFLVLPGVPDTGLFELKSISQNGARKVKDFPQKEHVMQMQTYMWLVGLQWGKILYWVKGVYSLKKNLIEHHVARDEEVIKQVKTMLTSIRRGFETNGEEMPERVCIHRSCSRAQECPVLSKCFGDPEPDDAVGII